MSIGDKCELKILKSLQKLSPDALKKIREDAEKLIESSQKANKDIGMVVREFADEYRRRIQMSKNQRMLTIQKYDAARAFINQKAFSKDPFGALRALFSEDFRKNYTGIGNISGRKRAISGEERRKILTTMNKHPGLRERLLRNDETLEIQLYALMHGADKSGFASDIVEFADTLKKVNNSIYAKKRQVGWGTRYLNDFVAPGMHNARVMREMGEDNWKALARRVFNFKRMGLTDEGAIEDRLTSMYHGKLQGEGELYARTTDDFKALVTNSVSERMGKQRLWHFNDGKAAFEYNKAMGGKSLLDRITDGLDKDSGNIAAAQILGPDFEATFTALINDANKNFFQQKGRKFNTKELKDLNDEMKFVVQGEHQPEMNLTAKVGKMLRQWVDVTRLDKAIISTSTDFPWAAGVLTSNTGENLLSGHAKIFKGFTNMFTSTENMREAAGKLSILADDMIKDGIGDTRFAEAMDGNFDTVTSEGRLAKFIESKVVNPLGKRVVDPWHTKYMKLTGLPRQSRSMRLAIGKMFSTHLSDVSDQKFNQLYSGMQQGMKKFGITEEKWDVLRLAVDDYADGTRGITPEMVHTLDDSKFTHLSEVKKVKENLLKTAKKTSVKDLSVKQKQKLKSMTKARIAELRNEISADYATYLQETTEAGSPTPGHRVDFLKSQISQDRNKVMGQVVRFALQYKSFILSQERTLHTISRRGNNPAFRASATIASAIGFGYLALSAKELLKGKLPKDPFSLETLVDSVVQSGAGLIYADFLTADYEKAWINLGSMMVGPVPSSLGEDFLTFISKASKEPKRLYDVHILGEPRRKGITAAELLRKVERHFINIPLTKTVLNRNLFQYITDSLDVDQRKRKGDDNFFDYRRYIK